MEVIKIENKFGDLVEKERNARGWSYQRLAQETEKFGNGQGLSASYLFRLVKGKEKGSNNYDPTTKTVKILMETLNLDISDVLKSLGMEQYLKDLYYGGYNQPTDLQELLLESNILIKTDSGELRPSKRQKRLIGDFVSDLCKIALNGGSFESFSNEAVGYAEKLHSLINYEKYVIELEDEEIHLELNIEVMVEQYGIKKEDILEDVNGIDVRALYESDLSILFLMGEEWICEKVKDDTILIKEKVSQLRKAFRKN